MIRVSRLRVIFRRRMGKSGRYVRITIGTPEEMDHLLDVTRAIYGK